MKHKQLGNYTSIINKAESIENKTAILGHHLSNYYILKEKGYCLKEVVLQIKNEVDFILSNK